MILDSSLPHWGALAALTLLFLPGAWISFNLRLPTLPFWARLFLGAILSPLVVCLEFYPLRLLGCTFEQTANLLAILNLPAAWLMWRACASGRKVELRSFVAGALVLLFCIVSLAPIFVDPERRLFIGHPWTYANAAYAFAKGDLIPEEPELAGFRMGYPVWLEGIYRAVFGYLTDSPPMFGYATLHLVFLIATYAFAIGIVSELGGGYLARITSGLILFFGTNPVGYAFSTLTEDWGWQSNLWGDPRYTPWVIKFLDLNTMPLVLPLIVFLIYLILHAENRAWTHSLCFLAGLVLCNVCLFYPILSPSVLGVVGAWMTVVLVDGWRQGRFGASPAVWLLGAAAVFTALLVSAELAFLREGRVEQELVKFSSVKSLLRKGFSSSISMLIFLLGLAWVGRECWRSRPRATAFQLLGAGGSLALHALFFLPYWSNEYKFIFVAAICLFPFPCLAIESLARSRGAAFTAVLLLPLAVGLVLPMLFVLHDFGANASPIKPRPRTDVRSFYLRLLPSEPLASLCEAVREKTPRNAVLVTTNAETHFPTLTARSIYIPPTDKTFAGTNLHAGILVSTIKGFGWEVVKKRRAVLQALYQAGDSSREAALSEILALGRPIALVSESHHADLRQWLSANRSGEMVFDQNGLSVWVIRPSR